LAAEQPNQILRLLGIDVWVHRQALVETAPAADSAAAAIKSAADSAAAAIKSAADSAAAAIKSAAANTKETAPVNADPASLTRELRETLQNSPRRRPVERSSESAIADVPALPSAQTPAAAQVSGNDLRACRVVALQRSKGLLLVDGADLVLARRLGRDLMSSSLGHWQDRPRETVFDWHPEKVTGVAVSGRRALGAFVNKQLDDLASGGYVLVCEEVLGLLSDLTEIAGNRDLKLCTTASLARLATDVDAKRTLWAQIQQLAD